MKKVYTRTIDGQPATVSIEDAPTGIKYNGSEIFATKVIIDYLVESEPGFWSNQSYGYTFLEQVPRREALKVAAKALKQYREWGNWGWPRG